MNDKAHEYFKDDGFEIYEGEFKADLPHGLVRAVYVDGVTYEGQFIEGKKCGRGVLKRHDYEIAGIFEDDLLVGPNWREAIASGDATMKFLDYMLSLDKMETRPSALKRLNNSSAMQARGAV